MKGSKFWTSGIYKRLIAFVIFAKFTASLVVDFICVEIYNGNAALFTFLIFSHLSSDVQNETYVQKILQVSFSKVLDQRYAGKKTVQKLIQFLFVIRSADVYCCHFNQFFIIISLYEVTLRY